MPESSSSQYDNLSGKRLTERPIFRARLPHATWKQHLLGIASGKVDDNAPYLGLLAGEGCRSPLARVRKSSAKQQLSQSGLEQHRAQLVPCTR